jgi:hypothetical protein
LGVERTPIPNRERGYGIRSWKDKKSGIDISRGRLSLGKEKDFEIQYKGEGCESKVIKMCDALVPLLKKLKAPTSLIKNDPDAIRKKLKDARDANFKDWGWKKGNGHQ